MIGSIRDRGEKYVNLGDAARPYPPQLRRCWRERCGRGFTLIEALIGATVFAVIAVSIYRSYIAIAEAGRSSRLKITAVALANEQLEIIRNLPYPDVGIVGGIPAGKIPRTQTLTRGGTTLQAETTIRNVDDPFDGTLGGVPNDTAPADFKIVELRLTCPTCARFQTFTITTRVGPRNLETATGNGALFVQALDANGLPVQGASVHVQNDVVTPAISIDDTTNNDGMLPIVDVPPGTNAYRITVTKSGYSTDQTYPLNDPANPNPVKPHATVVAQGVTQVSFAIDRLSTLDITSVDTKCKAENAVDFILQGFKLIGTAPDVLKYSASHTTRGNGTLAINNLEWDTYAATLTSATYELLGSIPLLPLTVLPDTSQPLSFVVDEKEPRTLLVTVRDAGTRLPVADATVTLSGPGTNKILTTGRGFLRQTDWSGGPGQETFTNTTKYQSSDGNINDNAPAGEVRLKSGATSGVLTSSTFDTGSQSEFHQIQWTPTDQPPAAGPNSVRFQIATSKNTQAAWVYKGPDGTSNTYYTLTDNVINGNHNSDRYLRYTLFLRTDDVAVTPNVADVSFTFTSDCVPPGQVAFRGLPAGDDTLTVSKSGYQPFSGPVTVNADWQQKEILLLTQQGT